jgi:copper oxidase (laccase) domain-containing protein
MQDWHMYRCTDINKTQCTQMSDCCLTPTQQFFSYRYIMGEQVNFHWDDDDVRFALDQHA